MRALLNSPEHVDKAPAAVYHELLDEGVYLCSISTMYRVLHENGEVHERRRQATHPPRVKPELLADAPNTRCAPSTRPSTSGWPTPGCVHQPDQYYHRPAGHPRQPKLMTTVGILLTKDR